MSTRTITVHVPDYVDASGHRLREHFVCVRTLYDQLPHDILRFRGADSWEKSVESAMKCTMGAAHIYIDGVLLIPRSAAWPACMQFKRIDKPEYLGSAIKFVFSMEAVPAAPPPPPPTHAGPSESSAQPSAPTSSGPSDPDASDERIYPTNVTLDTPNGKRITIENREVDGFFRKTGIFRAWASEYYAKKAMAEVIAANGFVKKVVYRSDTCHGAWLAPILARAMARKAGLGELEIEKAFRPEGVEPCVVQPQLEGSAGELLTTARKVRPGVPGHARACEFVKSLDGMVLRAHGRYIDASLLLKSVGKQWSRFWDSDTNKAFFEALVEKRGVTCSKLVIFETSSGVVEPPSACDGGMKIPVDESHLTGIWVDFGLGVKLATWANKRFEVEVCDLVVRYMTGQITANELNTTRTLLASHQTGDIDRDARRMPSLRGVPRSELSANRILRAPWIPCEILKSAGGYLGSLGEEVVDGVRGARLKTGETQIVEKRWSKREGGHASTAPHATLLWGARPLNPRFTGHDIQERVKAVLCSDWCREKGVKVIQGTSNEEVWCPLDVVWEVVNYVTRLVESAFGDDAVGCHSRWDAQREASSTSEDSQTVALAREETMQVQAREGSKTETARCQTMTEYYQTLRELAKAGVDVSTVKAPEFANGPQ
jgi:hypothetical protein